MHSDETQVIAIRPTEAFTQTKVIHLDIDRTEIIRLGYNLTPLEENYLTLPALPSHQEVLDSLRPPAPLWARLCLGIGTVLIILALAFVVVTR